MRSLLTMASRLLLFGCLLGSQAFAQTVPPAATPGGAQPKLDFEITEPFVYPNTEVVPEAEKPLPAEEAGAPRMMVRGFRIRGVIEREALGITQPKIEALVVAESQKLLQAAGAPGFTLSMFETLTRSIAAYYRERGYFLARAYIPEQKVPDGIVTIAIVEGFLDQVVYKGNQRYSEAQLQELFGPLVGEPVYLPDVERAIFIANEFPGLRATALFGPGLKAGSAAIQVSSEETPSAGFFSLDNYGSFYTGEQRLRANYQVNNFFGQADRLSTNLILTLDPQNSTYMDFAYEQPVLDYDYVAGGGYSLNSFDVGGNLADLGINGESSIINGYMSYIYRRQRSERMSATLDLSLKSAQSKILSTLDSQDKLTVLSLSGLYQGTSWSDSGAYQQLGVTLSLGLEGILGAMDSNGDGLSGRTGGSGNRASGGFSKINIDYLRLQKLAELQSLIFRASLQNSSDLLASMEQFSLGGPDSVRAYPVAEALVDNAWLLSVEWRAQASPDIPQTLLHNLQLFVFLDYAKGSLNDPLNNEINSVTFSGYGFGADVEPYRQFKARVQFAFDLGDPPSDSQSLPFYFSLRYDF